MSWRRTGNVFWPVHDKLFCVTGHGCDGHIQTLVSSSVIRNSKRVWSVRSQIELGGAYFTLPALFVPLEITDKTPAESWMIQRGHTVFRITGQTKDGRGGTDGRIDNPREKKKKKKKTNNANEWTSPPWGYNSSVRWRKKKKRESLPTRLTWYAWSVSPRPPSFFVPLLILLELKELHRRLLRLIWASPGRELACLTPRPILPRRTSSPTSLGSDQATRVILYCHPLHRMTLTPPLTEPPVLWWEPSLQIAFTWNHTEISIPISRIRHWKPLRPNSSL